MTIISRSLCRLSNLALASALIAMLGACGGGGGDVPTESPLAAGGPCKAKNESTGVQYMRTADPVGEAIAAATAGDTIRIWGVCYGNFVVNKNLSLQGQGAKATLDGNNSGTVLTVASGVSASLNDLTITHGRTNVGGGIHNDGTVNITNCTVSGNYAAVPAPGHGGSGGGIWNTGTLTLDNSTVSGNYSYSGGGIVSYGGTVTLTNTTISDNGGGWDSGGITVYGGGMLTVSNSTVSGNGGYSGGISGSGTMSLLGSTVTGNVAYGGGGINVYGGTLMVSDSIVTGNDAAHDGGGINVHDGTVTLSNSIVTGNTADGYGGGIFNGRTLILDNSTVSGNTAGASGGGIYNDSGTLTLTNSTVTDNSPDNFYPPLP